MALKRDDHSDLLNRYVGSKAKRSLHRVQQLSQICELDSLKWNLLKHSVKLTVICCIKCAKLLLHCHHRNVNIRHADSFMEWFIASTEIKLSNGSNCSLSIGPSMLDFGGKSSRCWPCDVQYIFSIFSIFSIFRIFSGHVELKWHSLWMSESCRREFELHLSKGKIPTRPPENRALLFIDAGSTACLKIAAE